MNHIPLSHLDQMPELNLLSASTRKAAVAAGGSSRDHWFVDRNEIHILPGFNVRIHNQKHEEYVRWLADEMKSVGFRVDRSISCYVSKTESGEAKIFAYDGHTRLEAYDLAASEGAELGPLPIAMGENLQNQNVEDLTLSLVTSNAGRELSPLEKAAVIKRLVGLYRWSEANIAKRLGMTTQHVHNMLLLANAAPEIRQMVANDAISASVAIEAIRTHGLKAAQRLAAAVDEAHSVGKTRATKKHLSDPAERFAKRQAPELLSVVRIVQADPGFSALGSEVQAKLLELVKSIEDAATKQVARAKEMEAKASNGTLSDAQKPLDLP